MLVDISTIIHQLHFKSPQLTQALFDLSPEDHAVTSFVAEYSDAIHKMLNDIGAVANVSTTLVFEGLATKACSVLRQKRRARNLNAVIRSELRKGELNGLELKKLSAYCGRPYMWLVEQIAHLLSVEHRYHVQIAGAGVQADSLIIALAEAARERGLSVKVVSNDSDFLCLTNAVSYLYNPKTKEEVSKALVLEKLEMQSEQLMLSYTMSGCDDIASRRPYGFGFGSASAAVKEHGWSFPLAKSEVNRFFVDWNARKKKRDRIGEIAGLAEALVEEINLLPEKIRSIDPSNLPLSCTRD